MIIDAYSMNNPANRLRIQQKKQIFTKYKKSQLLSAEFTRMRLSLGKKIKPPVSELISSEDWINAIISSAEELREAKTNHPPEKLKEDLLEALHTNKVLEIKNNELEHIAVTDKLTGLSNRRAFDHSMLIERERSIRNGSNFSLLLFDVDHFKNFNDTLGHHIGDLALAHLGHVIKQITRQTDSAYRYGGEEFALIMPEAGISAATSMAQRIQESLIKNPFIHGGITHTITVSIGIKSGKATKSTLVSDFIKEADDALYIAKLAKGRNCYSLSDENGEYNVEELKKQEKLKRENYMKHCSDSKH